NNHKASSLKTMKAKRSKSEAALYIKFQGQYDILIVSLYVDDLIFMRNNIKMMSDFKNDMMKTFEVIDLDLMNYFFGIEKDDGAPKIDASHYRNLVRSLLYLIVTQLNANLFIVELLNTLLRYLQSMKEFRQAELTRVNTRPDRLRLSQVRHVPTVYVLQPSGPIKSSPIELTESATQLRGHLSTSLASMSLLENLPRPSGRSS
ncbi:hypothetical protein CR513_46227, partial [Mucuna pruriens]